MLRLKRTGLVAAVLLINLAALPSAWAAKKPAAQSCTVILDAASGKVLLRDGICDRRLNPFSTFKLPLAVMGYDAGILRDETTPKWPYKAEYEASKRDRKPVDPVIWERDSVLWFSRELVSRMGRETFSRYVAAFGYGNADISGDAGKDNGLTHSWLASSLKISADEQADFVRRLLARELPVSDRAVDLTTAIMPTFAAGDGWTVHGKTGSGSRRDDKGEIDRDLPQGWFVGWAEAGSRRIVFARLELGVSRKESPKGPAVREAFVKALPKLMRDLGKS